MMRFFFLENAFNVFGIKICHKKRQEETFRICTCENIFFQNKISLINKCHIDYNCNLEKATVVWLLFSNDICIDV